MREEFEPSRQESQVEHSQYDKESQVSTDSSVLQIEGCPHSREPAKLWPLWCGEKAFSVR